MKIWHLQKGSDRRFRSGHPWIYSNELSESPKGLEAGAPVELRDAAGKFLARGYGNPASLIAFRSVSRDPSETEPLALEGLTKRLRSAVSLRKNLGFENSSYRLCHGEADGLPGLIVDRYYVAAKQGSPARQIFAVQLHTAGVDRLRPLLADALRGLSGATPSWEQTAIVLRNDVSVRKLEGLQEEQPVVLKEIPGFSLEEVPIRVGAAEFFVDLLGGQKTGFFLDQTGNVDLAISRLLGFLTKDRSRPVRILDLCCYVGQWSSQFSRALKAAGCQVEVTAVDASAKALDFARRNIEAQGARCETIRGDVLQDLVSLQSSFDLVISDPPGLIKNRKDIPAGTHAYLQLNTQALRLVREGGAVVACSCSALLEEESFLVTLAKAARRNRRGIRWVGRGGQAADHPMLAEFPEGRYLKAWIGICNSEN